MSRLARAEILLFFLLALHTLDHAVNQPSRSLPEGSGVIGILGFALVAVALLAALRGGRAAASVGLIAGAGTFLGFVIVHAPGIGPLADPYADFAADGLSWALLIAPMVATLVVAWIAAGELLRAPSRAIWT